MRIVRSAACAAAGAAAVAVATYPSVWRDWCITWGARPDEAAGPLPGDDLLVEPDIVTTRAITIEAAPGDIWPWIVQMGSGRGGVYTYDWIENLFGLQMQSADEILPEFQGTKVGDLLPVGPKGPRLRVEILEPDSAMVVREESGNWVWAFLLHPE